MGLVGIIGFIIGLFGFRVAVQDSTRLRVSIFAGLYVLHLIATIAFYFFSLSAQTDSVGYYWDYGGYYDAAGFGLTGTQLVFTMLRYGRQVIGGSYLDWFLLFQASSFLGICYLMRTIEDIYAELGSQPPFYAYLPLFLPGMHFWTSAIGKDGPLLLGACMALWASIELRKRWLTMGFALFVMMIFRPHIAVAGAMALSAMVVIDSRTALRTRLLLMIGGLLAIGYAALTLRSSFGIDISSGESISEFLAHQGEVTQLTDVAGNSAVYGSFPFKLFSLLFRPLFIDADDATGLLASGENLILAFLTGTILVRLSTTVRLFRKVNYIRFALLFGGGVCLLLAVVYYNIGLGLRQKTMFVPSIIVLFISVMAVRRARALATLPGAPLSATGLAIGNPARVG